MSITQRLSGWSVQCDLCGYGGFVGSYILARALEHFDLAANVDASRIWCSEGCKHPMGDGMWEEIFKEG